MKPGSELDALVAEKVMGLERVMTPGFGMEVGWRPIHSNLGASPLKSYSTDISAAWEVVEKMKQGSGHFSIKLTCYGWEALFRYPVTREATAMTAPHAICLAALKAIEVKLE